MGQTHTHMGQTHTHGTDTHTWDRHTHMGQTQIGQIYAKTFLFVHQSLPKKSICTFVIVMI